MPKPEASNRMVVYPAVVDSLLNSKQVAARLGLAQQTIRLYRSSPKGPKDLPYSKIGGAVRYRSEDVEEFIRSRMRTSSKDA